LPQEVGELSTDARRSALVVARIADDNNDPLPRSVCGRQGVLVGEAPISSCCNSERDTKIRNGKRGRYTLEFKQEAVRLVESGQGIAAAARNLGVVEQTLCNWVKAKLEGKLKEVSGNAGVTAEQMEISRLRAKLARVTMERDILGKATAYFAKGQK
jgi:transposase